MKKFLIVLVMLVAMNANAQWQPDVRLTNDTAVSYTSNNSARCISISGSIIHIVWYDHRVGDSEIYYKRSTDAGVSWGADTRLSNGTLNSLDPSIAVSGSVVHVVWFDYRDGNKEIYYKRSTNEGVSWGADIRLTNNTAKSDYPTVAVSGSVVHVVWKDNRDGVTNNEIYYKRSTDAGVTWGADTRLNYYSTQYGFPSIAVSGSIVHLVFSSTRAYPSPDWRQETFYKRSTDGGVSWGADTCISTIDGEQSFFPSIAVSGSYVHVAMYDERGGLNEIYYKRSTNGGVSWGTDVRLSYNIGLSVFPNIAASGSVVYVVYDVETANNKIKVYYNRSTDAGDSWGASTRLTTLDTANNSASFIEVSGPAVHVMWADRRNGNPEIYYKRNPTGNIGIQNISTETPSKYSLAQNYPNPFNSSSKFKFEISRHGGSSTGNVKIVVYDVMGREVQTLVNERLQPGTYETSFDGSMLNSGVYFYKMITDGFTETKRMILIK